MNNSPIGSEDWVGAFNGDVCVGAKQWITSQCGSGVCDLVVNGQDAQNETEGYMIDGQIPTFKIYDTSQDIYYDAFPSQNNPWQSGGQYLIDLLRTEENVTISVNGDGSGDFSTEYNGKR